MFELFNNIIKVFYLIDANENGLLTVDELLEGINALMD